MPYLLATAKGLASFAKTSEVYETSEVSNRNLRIVTTYFQPRRM